MLIVGAGLVGLVAAIRLRELGVDLRIVEQLPAEAVDSFPVLLHPRTLTILNKLGLDAPLEWRGHGITRVALHADGELRAVLEMPSASGKPSGAMTLPEGVLQQALLRRLSELGIDVEWSTQLVALRQSPHRVTATVVRKSKMDADSAVGLTTWLDTSTETVNAEFVIGADGHDSTVRRALGIGWHTLGPEQLYAVFEGRDERAGRVGQLVLNREGGSEVYSFQDRICRFTFEVSPGTGTALRSAQLEDLTARLPWCAARIEGFTWSEDMAVAPGIAASFGAWRVWLAGGAAHRALAFGQHSLNVGIFEGADLASRVAHCLGRSDIERLGTHYSEQRRLEWQRLLAQRPEPVFTRRAEAWVKPRVRQVLASLPATGDDLDDLLDQLGVATA